MGTRRKNAGRNIISGVVNKVIVLVLPFLLRSVILYQLGAEYLGLGSLFASILQVLSMAELGFSSAVIFSLYRPMAEGDDDTVCALLAFYRKIYFVVGSVIATAGVLLLPLIPKLIKGSYPDDINIYILYLLYLLNTVISYFFFAYKSVLLTASQRQDIISNINSVLTVIRCVIQIAFLVWFKNYYLYVILSIGYTVVYNIIIALVTQKRFPHYVCRGKLKTESKQQISKQIAGLAIGKFSLTARNSFDSIVLSMFCGLVELAIYSNYYYIFSAIMGFLSVIIMAITAGVGNSIATETIEKNYSDFKKCNYYFACISSWCTVCLLCLYQPFMQIWAGKNMTASTLTMVLFCIYFFITQSGQIRSMYTTAAGIWWELRYCEIAEMVLNLALNFILGKLFGMNGILLATIITVTVFGIIALGIITFKTYFKVSPAEYFKSIVLNAVGVTITGGVSYTVCAGIHMDGLAGIAIKLVVCSMITGMIIILRSIICKEERGYLNELRSMLAERMVN